jgi:hypothetical protein
MGTSEVTGGSFSRRTFLRLAGPAAVGLGGAAWRGRQAAAQPAVPGVREIELEAREVMWELAPGKRIKAMAYNGQIPGPELRVKEGERVRIVLTNGLAEPTTIHWHGVDVPNAMDGVPGLTQPRVDPGERFVYCVLLGQWSPGWSSRAGRVAEAGESGVRQDLRASPSPVASESRRSAGLIGPAYRRLAKSR